MMKIITNGVEREITDEQFEEWKVKNKDSFLYKLYEKYYKGTENPTVIKIETTISKGK